MKNFTVNAGRIKQGIFIRITYYCLRQVNEQKNPLFCSQLPQDMHKVLLEQVKSLTAEQLSLLPPEQRQQVIDLQQRLRLLEGMDAAT